MARYGVAPTKTNLLRLKREYSFACEGYDLLEQKRDILTTELLALVDRAGLAQEQMDNFLRGAFGTLHNALLRMGEKKVAETSLALNLQSSVSVSERRVMGVTLPQVEIRLSQKGLSHSPGETTFWADEAVEAFARALKGLAALAETSVSLRLLAIEVKKTIRRVNALERIALPDFRETLKYIGDVLDEMERHTFFTMKLVKNRLGQRRAEGGR